MKYNYISNIMVYFTLQELSRIIFKHSHRNLIIHYTLRFIDNIFRIPLGIIYINRHQHSGPELSQLNE